MQVKTIPNKNHEKHNDNQKNGKWKKEQQTT